jgi:beta-mannosidase
MTTHSLDGSDWVIRESLGDMWAWYVARGAPALNSVSDAPVTSARGWLPARVPGAVLDDLMRAGEVADPRIARQSRAAEWVADRHWVYQRTVHLPSLTDDDRVALEFEGIDPGGWVFWDGAEIARIDGLHRRSWLPVGCAGDAHLAEGAHTVTVVVPPALETEPQVGRTERVRTVAPRVGSGWDFAPRMRHQGIWRSARLIIAPVAISALRVRTTTDLDASTGAVLVDADLDLAPGAGCTLTADLRRDGLLVSSASVPGCGGGNSLRLEVAHVDLWWPAGYGEPALYDLAVTAGGDRREVRVGFREASLGPNPGAPEGALAYTGLVNGRAVALVGWNWAPADLLFGTVDAHRVRHLVALAADSGARILRVWGGGLIESDAFYDACDENGILVWQEFSQSSSGMQSAPAADPAFVAHAVAEAEHAAARLSRHPSLFLWCGGNELEDDEGPLDESRSPVLAALRETVARHDPGRAWLPTSPSGPTFHHRLDRIAQDPLGQHDVHGPWEHQGLEGQHTLADAGTSLAHTEFGVEGMASLRSLHAIIPPASLWPADRSNPVYRHLGDWWNNSELVADAFGGRLDRLELVQRASQWLQATGLQYAIEADRRRSPRCSMVLPWQLAESFPNAWCTSAVEWSGEAKPALHAARRAFARDRVTVRTPRSAWAGHQSLSAQAWAWSEDGVPAGSRVVLRVRDLHGGVLAEEVSEAAGPIADPRPLISLEMPHPGGTGVVLWEAVWHDPDGSEIERELAAASLGGDFAALIDLPSAAVTVDLAATGDAWQIGLAHAGGPAVMGPVIHDARPWDAPGRLIVRDDPRPLLPGESRTIVVHWSGGDPAERSLSIDAWNLPEIRIEPPGSHSTAQHDEGAA